MWGRGIEVAPKVAPKTPWFPGGDWGLCLELAYSEWVPIVSHKTLRTLCGDGASPPSQVTTPKIATLILQSQQENFDLADTVMIEAANGS